MPTKIENFLARILLKWDRFKYKHMPWTKLRRISDDIKRLEKKLFGND